MEWAPFDARADSLRSVHPDSLSVDDALWLLRYENERGPRGAARGENLAGLVVRVFLLAAVVAGIAGFIAVQDR